jgi:hypothetical protein
MDVRLLSKKDIEASKIVEDWGALTWLVGK